MGKGVTPKAPVALSVVVPAYNEAPNLEALLAEVHAALDPTGLAWELVVVDDGSSDGTPALLARLAAADSHLRVHRMECRSGQTAALVAGLHAARGELIATLDADLQCPPSELPALLAAMGDADLACGIRARRHDPLSRRLASMGSNVARRLIVAPHVRDLACPLRVFRASALRQVEALTPLFDGAHRWLPALFALAGLRVVQRPVEHLPRRAGVSKYTTRGRLVPVARELGRVIALVLRQSRRGRAVAAVALLALTTLLFFHALGSWPLMEPDEGRNAEVAREMLALGSWSVPRFNLLPYLDKPVFLFWLIASAFRVVGVGELGARLPAAVSAVAVVALTFAIARLLVGRRRALLAAGMVATMPIVLVFARLAIFDMPLTALMMAALWCLLRARLEGSAARWLPLAGLLMGLAVLTKGPVGFAVPLLAWFAGRGALPPLRRTGPWPVVVGLGLAVTVVATWLVFVMRQEPAFLRYAVFDETILRFLSPARFHRGGPSYYYVEVLAWALGVWGIVLLAVAPGLVRRWRAGGSDASAIAFTARAAVAIVVLFTVSASKRPQYILPAMVPLAILTAIGVANETARAAAAVRGTGRWAIVFGIIAAAVAFAGLVPHAGDFRAVTPATLTTAGLFLVPWGLVTAIGGRRPAVAILCAALFAPGLGLVLLRPLTGYAEGRSSRALAASILPGVTVVCFEAFPTGLPFYLRRPVLLLSASGRELTSNYILAQAGRLMGQEGLAPLARFKDLMSDGAPPYVLATPWRLARLTRLSPLHLVPVYADRRNVLLRPEG
jgi:4-amino-4-deoxy-L-arabinose transferase-like glycosyltransferase